MGAWAYRIILWPTGLVAILMLIGAFAPLPSTLMLKRWATGERCGGLGAVVPLERIAPSLPRAVIASEDAASASTGASISRFSVR